MLKPPALPEDTFIWKRLTKIEAQGPLCIVNQGNAPHRLEDSRLSWAL
ncbi:MAG: hypothetical protein QNJ46_01590 [Leptolyngbyaceae cyanobacterium MO_188.B28]|nr:hypothetical protein [Leptolyngbyaceae cyanobacterium MO_188.B28]